MAASSQDIIASLTSAASTAILLPTHPAYEVVAAGLGLFLVLSEQGKNVDIVCPSEMLVEVNRLVGVDKIKTKCSGRNLVISFDYVKDAIEKVSYNVEDGKFNLVVQPKSGHPPLSAKNVQYALGGSEVSLVILIGTTNPADAEGVLPDKNPQQETLSLVAGNGTSLVTETVHLITDAKLPLSPDAASNLLKGLVSETGRFATAVATDFETAAALARAGGSLQDLESSSKPAPQTPVVQKPTSLWTGPKIYRSGEQS